MNQNDLLLSIGRAKTITATIEESNAKLAFYHTSPLNMATQIFMTFVVNFLWVGIFAGLTYLSFWALFALPFALYFWRGAVIARKIESHLMRRKLDKCEDDVGALLRQRSECVNELREVTGLADRFFTLSNMELFEGYINEGKASNFNECAALLA